METNAPRFLNILIASPSDVPDERRATDEEIARWNSNNAERLGAMMISKMWERDVMPSMAGEPQSVVNAVGDQCNALIGIFHARIGTPTINAESGTIEEIERFMAAGKRVAIYFSNKPTPLQSIDAVQFTKVRAFQDYCKNKGIYGTFDSTDKFKHEIHKLLDDMGRSFAHPADRAMGSIPLGGSQGDVLQMVSDNQVGWAPIFMIQGK